MVSIPGKHSPLQHWRLQSGREVAGIGKGSVGKVVSVLFCAPAKSPGRAVFPSLFPVQEPELLVWVAAVALRTRPSVSHFEDYTAKLVLCHLHGVFVVLGPCKQNHCEWRKIRRSCANHNMKDKIGEKAKQTNKGVSVFSPVMSIRIRLCFPPKSACFYGHSDWQAICQINAPWPGKPPFFSSFLSLFPHPSFFLCTRDQNQDLCTVTSSFPPHLLKGRVLVSC